MKAIFKRFKKAASALLLSPLILLCCDTKELQIQQDFPFEVTVMPIPKEVAKGGTVEIRISIKRDNRYSGAGYFIRFFQFDGKGTLQYQDEPAYIANDLYPLKTEKFRLYYTSQSSVSQSFDVWISDNFGNEKKLSFQFNNID
ncbi:DUF3872 domain-containing protein [Flavobacterium procerum]|uniref:DUF3872 domain-containing protein n=1 Tax=Flavobacterium procerum TaxID=1455569 RepID=A0ABV6BT56_9FLAO